MSGRIVTGLIVAVALISIAALYGMQLFASDEPVEVEVQAEGMRMVNVVTGEAERIIADDLQDTDPSSTSPDYRACFTTPSSLAMLTETYVVHEAPSPLPGPAGFDCFDAAAIGAALDKGSAVAFLGDRNIRAGVDRVIAVFPDGRAYAWHQLNETYEE